MHESWPASLWYSPVAQSVQADALPVLYFPAGQVESLEAPGPVTSAPGSAAKHAPCPVAG